jgi:hypothetical protein
MAKFLTDDEANEKKTLISSRSTQPFPTAQLSLDVMRLDWMMPHQISLAGFMNLTTWSLHNIFSPPRLLLSLRAALPRRLKIFSEEHARLVCSDRRRARQPELADGEVNSRSRRRDANGGNRDGRVPLKIRLRGGAALPLLFISFALHAQTNFPSGSVFTIAGNSLAHGYSGDGGQATNAQFAGPFAHAIGPDGSIYFADNGNARIRRITPNGIITTIAGNGEFDDYGDGGQATNAAFGSGVVSIAVDGVRNVLYLADGDNNRVRAVNLTNGIISNFAGLGNFGGGFGFGGDGGPAGSAKFRVPDSVAVDRAGNVYITDDLNQRVRKVTITNGIISTIAGSCGTPSVCAPHSQGDGGPATASIIIFPFRVAVDDIGNAFVVDTDSPSRRIRRIDAVTHIITTVAGGGTNTPTSGPATSMRLSECLDIAVNRAGTTLFIADKS